MKDIVILAKDDSLTSLVFCELSSLGYSVGFLGERECSLLIADADSPSVLEAAGSLKRKGLIYISRTPDKIPKSGCRAILRRPLRVSELREVCTAFFEERKKEALVPSVRRDTVRLVSEEHLVILNSKHISLSEKEFLLLSRLNESRGSPVVRAELEATIGACASNELEVYICHLRRKLENGKRRLILTERGVGYKLI